jgi:hypothetical protein
MKTVRHYMMRHKVMLCLTLLLILGGCGNMPQTVAPTPTLAPSLDTPEGAAMAILGSPQSSGLGTRYNGDWHVVLDTPALVHAYHAHTGVEYQDSDHWVASMKVGETRTGLYDFVYQRTHKALRFASFGAIASAENPHAHQSFPYTSEETALMRLKATRGLEPKAGVTPELIFFPPADWVTNVRQPAAHPWTSGGIDPLSPMWRITATDGNDYFVGNDLLVHTADELPIDPSQKG